MLSIWLRIESKLRDDGVFCGVKISPAFGELNSGVSSDGVNVFR